MGRCRLEQGQRYQIIGPTPFPAMFGAREECEAWYWLALVAYKRREIDCGTNAHSIAISPLEIWVDAKKGSLS